MRRVEGAEHRALAYAWKDGRLRGGPVKHGEKSFETDYPEAWKAWKRDTGVTERSGQPIAQHMLCIVSPGAIPGDPRDIRNRHVVKLVEDAVSWANNAFGPNSVFAARYDVDETGSGVCDILVAPHHVYRSGRGKPRDRIAVYAGQERLRKKWKRKHGYSAMQDSWHDFASKAGWNVERGIPKELTSRDNLSPEHFKGALPVLAQKTIAAKDAELADQKAELESLRLQLAAERARNRR